MLLADHLMESKNNTIIRSEDCEKPRIKQEPFNQDEITAGSHYMKCVQYSDVDIKVGVKQETLEPNVARNDIKCNPKQSSTYQDAGTAKVHQINIKAENFNQPNSDVETKEGIKEAAWHLNGISSSIKCDPEQPPTLDLVAFLGTGTIKGDDEIDIKEEHWWCEETSADSLNEGEESYSMKIEAEDEPLSQSRRYTGAVGPNKATQLQDNKNASFLHAKINTPIPKCETKRTCKTCGESFKTLSHLKEHKLNNKECKGNNTDENCSYSDASKGHLTQNQRREYTCDTCGRTFSMLKNLKAHFFVHDDQRQYKCKICGKSFKRIHILKRHLLVHDKRKFKCKICDKSFKTIYDLKLHLVIHDDIRQYKCQTCGKSFKLLSYLKKHLLIHDDKRQYKCQICEKSFKTYSTWKKHFLVHDERRQFKCQICEKSFKDLNVMRAHLLVHDDKRQFKCEICTKSFKRLQYLTKHLSVHNDKRQFKCEICGKSFKRLEHLKRHLLLHDNRRQF